LPATPQIKFSYTFPGVIWATLAAPGNSILILEVRDQTNFQVQFSALDFTANTFLWKGVEFRESWWIGLTAANERIVLLHTYVNKGNPDHKNLIAVDIFSGNIRWQVEEFSFFDWNDPEILGHLTKGELKQATIHVENGAVTERNWLSKTIEQRADIVRPVHYLEGTPHFETVKAFIQKETNHVPAKGIEYLEWKNRIMVSLYRDEEGSLANYLLVFDEHGEVLLEVKLGEKLSGLGTDTFFILSGCLFLIKNKTELVAYTFYD
jgi:hypothetical protein